MARFPGLNPMIFPDAVCCECGQLMEKEVVLGPRDRVIKVVYRCENTKVGCSYQVESDQRLNGMCLPVKREPNSRSLSELKGEEQAPAIAEQETSPLAAPKIAQAEDTEDAAG